MISEMHHAPDGERINVTDDNQIQQWAEKYDVPQVTLKAAIQAVGTRVEDVERFLRERDEQEKKLRQES